MKENRVSGSDEENPIEMKVVSCRSLTRLSNSSMSEESKSLRTESDEENPKDLTTPEAILRNANEKLAARGHPSTIYPPQFMPTPTLKERLSKVAAIVSILLLIVLFVWFSASQYVSGVVTAVLIALFPLIVISSALCTCAMYHLEYIEHLNFRAIQVINVGAIINLITGLASFETFGPHEEDIGFFVGTTILSFGTVMFSFCTMILGPWEFMAGSPLLSIGLLLRNCALFQKLTRHSRF